MDDRDVSVSYGIESVGLKKIPKESWGFRNKGGVPCLPPPVNRHIVCRTMHSVSRSHRKVGLVDFCGRGVGEP